MVRLISQITNTKQTNVQGDSASNSSFALQWHKFFFPNRMTLLPTRFFLTKGTGTHEKELRAFEEALRDAGIQVCNLVKISSIIPPGCKRIPRQEGVKELQPGQITFAVMAQSQTNEPGQTVA